MNRTVRLSLTPDKSLGIGYLLSHCGRRQPVPLGDLDPGQWWECAICCKPLIFVANDAIYEVGENITI